MFCFNRLSNPTNTFIPYTKLEDNDWNGRSIRIPTFDHVSVSAIQCLDNTCGSNILIYNHLNFHSIVPESPRWLLLKGYEEEALQILRTLAMYNGTKVPPEVKLKKEEESTTSSSVLDLFSFSTICTRTSVMMACW